MMISTGEEFDRLKGKEEFQFICKNCGASITAKKREDKKRKAKQRRLLCKKCSSEVSNLEKFGVKNYSQTDECKAKMKQTCIEKYGTEWASQSEEIRTKIKSTCNGKKDAPKKEVKKIKESFKKEKPKKIKKDESSKNISRNESIQKTEQSSEVIIKVIDEKPEIDKNKVGFYKIFNDGKRSLEEIVKTNHIKNSKYKFEGIQFGSSLELAFYKYHKDSGDQITYKPCFFTYIYKNKFHKFFPSFRLNGKLITIKGDHNCFEKELEEIRNQCIAINNIIILYKKDLQEKTII